MKQKLIFAASLLAVTLFTGLQSCKKEKRGTPDNGTLKANLVNKEWIVRAATLETPVDINDDEKPDTNVYAIRFKGKCREDDTKEFLADGVFLANDNFHLCSDRNDIEWIWALSADNSKIVLTPDSGNPVIWEIISLTATELKIRYLETKMFREPMLLNLTYEVL